MSMPLLTYDAVFDRVRSCNELATFSRSLTEILHITQSASGNAKQLAAVISKDPALATKILRTVNSCFYAIDRTIENVEDAVVVLGFAEVERLSLAISVINQFSGRRAYANLLQQLWRHSLVCAVAAETLLELYRIRTISPSEVYMAALLHDIGKAVILQVFPEVLPAILEAMERSGATAYAAEHRLLGGATHCAIGAWASEQWNLSLATVEGIQLHHTPNETPGAATLPKLIYMADAACYYFHVPAIVLGDNAPQPGPDSCRFLQTNEAFVNRFRERWEAKRSTIETLSAG
jgi:HD-like signal output (HDOD) protein